MLTIGIETTTATGSLALFENKTILATREWSRTGSHSEFITTSFKEILSDTRLTSEMVARVAVGTGPGSFTGIRVGVNFARTIGYTLQRPIFTLNSLHLLASQVTDSANLPIRVLQYAFRDLIYTAEYKLDHGRVTEVSAPIALATNEFTKLFSAPTLAIGTGADLVREALPDGLAVNMIRNQNFHDLPLAADFLQTAALDESPATLTDWIHTIPLYVRASEAEEKLRKGLLKPLT